MDHNFIERLFVESINVMATNKWDWPEYWDHERRMKFLNESLRFAEDRELFEQCAIIRDVKENLQEI